MLKDQGDFRSGDFITEVVDGVRYKGPGDSTMIDTETLLEVFFGGLPGLELFS